MVRRSNDAEQTMTVVKVPKWLRVAYVIGFPLLGVGVGWVAQAIAGWIASLPAAPFQGPFELVASLPQPHALIGALVVGGLAGLVLAALAHADSLTVRIFADRVVLTRGDVTSEVPADSITAVFCDNDRLVLLSTDGAELAREKCDLDADRLAAAFREHGLAWYAADPYEQEYRRWVEDLPDLPPTANALLRARARALEKDDGDDAEQLRRELGKLNVVVRDRDERQFWRRTTASSNPPPPH